VDGKRKAPRADRLPDPPGDDAGIKIYSDGRKEGKGKANERMRYVRSKLERAYFRDSKSKRKEDEGFGSFRCSRRQEAYFILSKG